MNSEADEPRVYGGGPCRLDDEQLDRAKLLLEAGEPVKVVTKKVGYRSETAFSNAFHRLTGIRPGAFARAGGSPKPIPTGAARRPHKRRPKKVSPWTAEDREIAQNRAKRAAKRTRKEKAKQAKRARKAAARAAKLAPE